MRHVLVSKLQAALDPLSRDLVFGDIAAPLIERGIIFAQEYRCILTATSEAERIAMLIDMLSGKEDASFHTFIEILQKDYDWLAEVVENGPSEEGDVTDSVPISRPISGNNSRALSPIIPHQKRSHSPSIDKNSKRREVEKPPEVNQRNTSAGSDPVQTSEQHNNDRRVDPEKLAEVILTDEMMNLVKKNHRTSRDWTSLAHALGLSRLVNKIRVKVLVFGEDLDGCVVHLLQEWAGEKPKDANLRNLINALRGEGFNDVADELVEKFVT